MTNLTDTNQASEDELELIVARISAGIGGFGKLASGNRYNGISEEAGIELLKAYIRTEKLKLLAAVREQTTIFKIKAHDKNGEPHLYEAGRGVTVETLKKMEAEL